MIPRYLHNVFIRIREPRMRGDDPAMTLIQYAQNE